MQEKPLFPLPALATTAVALTLAIAAVVFGRFAGIDEARIATSVGLVFCGVAFLAVLIFDR